jgi:hypothetical protein
MKHASAWLSLSFVLLLATPLAWATDAPEDSDNSALPVAREAEETAGSEDPAEPGDSQTMDAEPEYTEPDDIETAAPTAPSLGPQISSKVQLTPEEKAEKEARKACKIEICDIIATREPLGDDIACDIKETWRADSLTEMLGDQIGWPWGKAVCESKLNLSRADLAEAMLVADTTIKMDKFAVSCALHRDSSEPYVVEVELAPEVTFKNGKAVSATINWGDVSAPLLIYPVVYAGTGVDNQSNVLGSKVVTMVNEFTQKKCAEVKDELPGRRVN